MGAFKLGKMTLGSLFKKPETILYPFETKPQPVGLKGHIEIDVDDCILCGMCERSCSTDCITVSKNEHYWQIDRFACVQCGYCVTVCPKKCLSMAPDYAAASTSRHPERVDVPVPDKTSKPAAKPAREKACAAPAPQDSAPQGQDQVEAVAAAPAKEAATPAEEQLDSQVEALLALMGADAAARVKNALSGKAV